MPHQSVCLFVLSVCAVTCVSECHAQIRARVRQRIAASLAPPASPAVPPAAGPSDAAGAPGATPSAPTLRGGFLARRLQLRRDLVAQEAAEAQPTPAAPAPQQQQVQRTVQQTQRTAQRRPLDALRQASAQIAPALRMLTQGQMSQMDLPELQSALADTNGNLANELNQFSSAPSWQRFFEMPTGIVDDGTIDLATLQTALVRFENVAANPKFSQISALSSFQQSKSLLTELVNRADPQVGEASTLGNGPQLIDPTGASQLSAESAESLPAPGPRLPRNEGEHSILVRNPKS